MVISWNWCEPKTASQPSGFSCSRTGSSERPGRLAGGFTPHQSRMEGAMSVRLAPGPGYEVLRLLGDEEHVLAVGMDFLVERVDLFRLDMEFGNDAAAIPSRGQQGGKPLDVAERVRVMGGVGQAVLAAHVRRH